MDSLCLNSWVTTDVRPELAASTPTWIQLRAVVNSLLRHRSNDGRLESSLAAGCVWTTISVGDGSKSFLK